MTDITSIPLIMPTAWKGNGRQPRPLSSHMQRHIDDLLEVLKELLALPEQTCSELEHPFDDTLETLAKARVGRAAVLDDLAGGAP